MIIEAVIELNNTIEETPKITSILRGRRRGATLEAAGYEAANYGGSPNFSLGSRWSQALSLLFMFYNPRLQGTVGNVRRLGPGGGGGRGRGTPPPGGGSPPPGSESGAGAAWLRIAMFIAMPTIALWAWNRSFDDDYGLDEIPEEERQNYVVILRPDTYQHSSGEIRRKYWKLAREETWKVVAPAIEAALDRLDQEKPVELSRLVVDALGNASPINFNLRLDLEPSGKEIARSVGAGGLAASNPLYRIPVEVGFNYSGFGQRPLVPRGLEEGVLAVDQSRPTTSPLMIQLGKILGQSPLKLEYAVTSATGGLGRGVIDTIDRARGKVLPDVVGEYESVARQPILARFMGTGGGARDRNAEERFYRALDEAQRTTGSAKTAVEMAPAGTRTRELAGDVAAMVKIEFVDDLREMARELGEIRQAQVYIVNHLVAPVEQKQQAMRLLAQERSKLLDVFRQLDTATAGLTRPLGSAPAVRAAPGRR